MQVRDDQLFGIVERLGDHYIQNINNRVMRKALLKMDLNGATWDRIERLTQISDLQRSDGFSYQELYEQVLAMALFIDYAHHRLLPNLRRLLTSQQGRGSGGAEMDQKDRLLRDLAVNNFRSNLGILSDIVKELYHRTVELDQQDHGRDGTVLSQLPELKQLGQLLL